MKKQYWIILIVYIAMQLSVFIGVPLFAFFMVDDGRPIEEIIIQANAYWSIFSFITALLVILWLLRNERQSSDSIFREPAMGWPMSLVWAFAGIFMALFAQSIALMIEMQLGIDPSSENTETILSLISTFPLFIIVSSILGPILEEIVFRKIIFGQLYRRMNFFWAGLISSVIFAIAHTDYTHILLYSAMGFTFAYLYIRTKRIIVPIIAHVSMNTLVVLAQFGYLEQGFELMQSFIGGFL